MGELRAAPLLGLAAAASRSTFCAPRRLPSGNGLSAAIQTAMTASTDKRIVVVGHSLGGALANIAAVDLVENYGAKVSPERTHAPPLPLPPDCPRTSPVHHTPPRARARARVAFRWCTPPLPAFR